MKNALKKILPCLLVIVSLFTITGCKKEKSTYPSVVPNLPAEFASQTYATIGEHKITNGNIYYRLLQSYGMNVLQQVIDSQLLTKDLTPEQEEDFQEHMSELIYKTDDITKLTDEEKAKLEEEFKIAMISDGLYVDDAHKADPLHYENFHRLEYKRLVKTLEVLKQEVIDFDTKADKDAAEAGTDPVHYYKTEDFLNFFVDNFHKSHDLIVVTFDSQKQGLEALKKAGVNTASLEGAWKSLDDGHELTKEELVTVFKDLYKTAYGKDCEGEKTYFYNDLIEIATSSTPDRIIANRAISLDSSVLAKSYTHGPLSYNGRWYAMISLNDSADYYYDNDTTVKYEDKAELVEEKDAMGKVTKITKALEEKLLDELIYTKLSSSATTYQNQIARVMFKVRQDAHLEIFAEGLEVNYKNAYNSAFNALKIAKFDKFAETQNVSDTVVFKWDGGEVKYEDMFNKLTERYGALVSLLFLQQVAILNSKYNTVVNYDTGEILDQKKYDEYFKKDLTSYKQSFEKGSFASYGYPASYGWENFLRDYIGITDEAQAVLDFNSSLYSDVLGLYTAAIYEAKADEVTVEANAKTGTWWLKSTKWQEPLGYDTEVSIVDETKIPTVLLVYSKDEFTLREEDKDMTTNDFYGHFVLRTEAGDFVTKVTVDQAVYEEYDKIFADTFSASAVGVKAYYDVNNDGKQDELTDESSEQAMLAKSLVDKVWALVEAKKKEDSTKTIYKYLTDIVREYETSSLDSDWKNYRVAGLRLEIFENNSYNRTSDVDENLKNYVFNLWYKIAEEYPSTKDGDQITGTTITGQALDPGYRYVKNSKAYYVTALDFTKGQPAVFADNGYYQLAVTKATAKTTKYYYTTSNGVEKNIQNVTKYLYDQYLLDSEDRDVTVNCTAQITAYYATAIGNLASEKIINTKLMNDCLSLLDETTFTKNNDQVKATLKTLIEAGIKKNAPEA